MNHKLLFAGALAASTILASGNAVAGQFTIDQVVATNRIVTTGDPNDPLYANAGANLRTGIGFLRTPISGGPSDGFALFCSGAMIAPNLVLTAAHCVDSFAVDGDDGAGGTFQRPIWRVGGLGGDDIEVKSIAINPLWLDPAVGRDAFGAFGAGDIAVVSLKEDVPAGTEIYNLYTGSDPGEAPTRHYGFGTSGTGATGGDTFDLIGRTGLNLYEATLADLFGGDLTGAMLGQLLYDFDNGLEENNGLAWWLSTLVDENGVFLSDQTLSDLGFGIDEVFIDGGDSGGPGFLEIGGELFIAGVHSFGLTLRSDLCDEPEFVNQPDVSCTSLNSSFGEIAGDTSVSFHIDFLNRAIARLLVPEPASMALFGAGLLGLGLARRRRSK